MDLLVFDHEFKGHHESFIKILISYASENEHRKFVFVLNPALRYIEDTALENVTFDFLAEKELNALTKFSLVNSAILFFILFKRVRKFNVSDVILISLMKFVPFVILFCFSKVRISGIIYQIFLYRYKNSSFLKKTLDIIIYTFFVQLSLFKNVYLLEDKFASGLLNRKFRTSKFKYLPDPVILFEQDSFQNIFVNLEIPFESVIYLHVGYLESRKGTIEIMDAVAELNPDEMIGKVFIFAGEVDPLIKEMYFFFKAKFTNNKSFFFFEERISDGLMHSLIKYSDYILLPYSNVNQSSGILQLSRAYGKWVVLMRGGYLERSLRDYANAIYLEGQKKVALYEFILNSKKLQDSISHVNYNPSISLFCRILFQHND